MRDYLNLALEEASIETVNGMIESFNSEHSEDGVQIHLVNAESALADLESLHKAHNALQALDVTTAQMGDNVSVESMDIIKQYIGFINSSTGFKISLEDGDNSKGFFAKIWDAIKRFFASIWNFITGSNKKQTEVIRAKVEFTKDVLSNLITKMEKKINKQSICLLKIAIYLYLLF